MIILNQKKDSIINFEKVNEINIIRHKTDIIKHYDRDLEYYEITADFGESGTPTIGEYYSSDQAGEVLTELYQCFENGLTCYEMPPDELYDDSDLYEDEDEDDEYDF